VQNFNALIKKHLVYADKTEMIYNLARTINPYFLSRPRRFGKSLLLSTFEALFRGREDPDGPPQRLFKDLWIGRSDWDFTKKYPVISLNMNVGYESRDTLKSSLNFILMTIARREEIDIYAPTPGLMLSQLIEELSLKYKTETVILIDEYDAPVSENLGNAELMKENAEELKMFYSSLKNCQTHLRFVFVTGVTRYALMGLSAGLNNLDDITFNKDFSSVCGFTLEELDTYFKKYMSISLQELKNSGFMPQESTVSDLRQEILNWYDGYSWDGITRVLNPWSILKFFETSHFKSFWGYISPSASFLSNLIKGDPFTILERRIDDVPLDVLEKTYAGSLAPIAGLFQTGYLTIEKMRPNEAKKTICSLKIPNKEIEQLSLEGFSDLLFDLLDKKPEDTGDCLEEAIRNLDSAKITELFSSLYAGLPARHHPRLEKGVEQNESFYHSVMYAYCFKLGSLTLAEHAEANGVPDLILFFHRNNLLAVIELKFQINKGGDPNELLVKLARKALAAIKAKDYGASLKAGSKQVVKIGIGITTRGKCLALIDDLD
jgi:ribosomal protein L29